MKKNYLPITGLLCLSFLMSCAQHISTANLEMECTGDGTVVMLKDRYTGLDWVSVPGSFYQVDADGVHAQFRIGQNNDGSLQLFLSLVNKSKGSVTVEPRFPAFEHFGLDGISPDSVFFLFPRQGQLATNTDPVRYSEVYSGSFPFQFFDFYRLGKGGVSIQTCDLENYPKQYYLKRKNGCFTFGVIYRARVLAPGEAWELPPVTLTAHAGDWHEAFAKYCGWLKSNLKPVTGRKDWFRDVYNFRQTFLYDNGGEKGAYDLSTRKIDLESKVIESERAFGGVDYLHIFDWGQTPAQGRCGDYSPWEYLDKKELVSQIAKVKSLGIPVGIYHEGYLLSPESDVCREHGKQWQMLDRRGRRYDRFGDGYYYPCPLLDEWREYISTTVKRSSDETGADGVYIDQFGFGWQYGCYNPAHGHDTLKTSVKSEMQVPAEAGLMAGIKRKLPEELVTYTEECPTDVSTQYQDGSFTYAISLARDSARFNPSAVNLARFAFPDYKLIEILHIDSPVGEDLDGVRYAFFNGEGLWLSGPLDNPAWFPGNLREMIRKCYAILRENRDAFRSLNPEPLVATLCDSIHANYFPGETRRVWTLYNVSDRAYDGKVLETGFVEGARYYDAWNGVEIRPERKDSKVALSVSIQPRDAGCIVELLPETDTSPAGK